MHAGDARAAALDAVDRDAEAEVDAQHLGRQRELLRELEAVTRLVARQAQATDELALHRCERRLVEQAPGAIQHLVGHAEFVEDGDVLGDALHLLLRAQELQRALAALVVVDADLGTQRSQAVAAVFGQAHHPALVEPIGAFGAIGEHREAPAPHRGVEQRLDHQRAVLHQQPLDRLDRNPRSGPRRRVAGRHLAGVGIAGFEAGTGLPVDDRHLVAGAGELIGHRRSDHATAEHHDAHVCLLGLSCCSFRNCRASREIPYESMACVKFSWRR